MLCPLSYCPGRSESNGDKFDPSPHEYAPGGYFEWLFNCGPFSAGALVLVINYTGDRINFGLAVEKARNLGLKVCHTKKNYLNNVSFVNFCSFRSETPL